MGRYNEDFPICFGALFHAQGKIQIVSGLPDPSTYPHEEFRLAVEQPIQAVVIDDDPPDPTYRVSHRVFVKHELVFGPRSSLFYWKEVGWG